MNIPTQVAAYAARNMYKASDERRAELEWSNNPTGTTPDTIRNDHYAGHHDNNPNPNCDKGRCKHA